MSIQRSTIVSFSVIVGAGLLGYLAGISRVETVTVEKRIEVQVQGKAEIVYRDHIITQTVTKTVFPNGTVQETTTNKNEDKAGTETVEVSTDTTVSNKDITVTPVLPQYSLGVRTHISYLDLLPTTSDLIKGAEVTLGRRILGPMWLDIGVQPAVHQLSLGIRIDL